jgi:hypothetical protein
LADDGQERAAGEVLRGLLQRDPDYPKAADLLESLTP